MTINGPYIVPEQNIPRCINGAADIWMFGCAIYQFLSGFDLMGTLNEPSLKMLHQMMRILRPPQQWMLDSWKAMHGDTNIELIEEPSWSLATRAKEIREGNANIGLRARLEDFTSQDISTLTELLSYMMRFDPASRPTIQEVLKHLGMVYFRA